MPLRGSSKFVRSQEGYMDFDLVNYVEFHADTYDFGYTLWVDGVQFHDCTPLVVKNSIKESDLGLNVYPNPSTDITWVNFNLNEGGLVKLSVFDLKGSEVIHFEKVKTGSGDQKIRLDLSPLPKGIYSCRVWCNGKMAQALIAKN